MILTSFPIPFLGPLSQGPLNPGASVSHSGRSYRGSSAVSQREGVLFLYFLILKPKGCLRLTLDLCQFNKSLKKIVFAWQPCIPLFCLWIWRLVCCPQFKRSLLSCGNLSRSQKVYQVYSKSLLLPVHHAAFRSVQFLGNVSKSQNVCLW